MTPPPRGSIEVPLRLKGDSEAVGLLDRANAEVDRPPSRYIMEWLWYLASSCIGRDSNPRCPIFRQALLTLDPYLLDTGTSRKARQLSGCQCLLWILGAKNSPGVGTRQLLRLVTGVGRCEADGVASVANRGCKEDRSTAVRPTKSSDCTWRPAISNMTLSFTTSYTSLVVALWCSSSP